MSRLTELHADIDRRVQSIRDGGAEWPCAKGCDRCCRRLAEIPSLTRAEWELLREGLAALPAAQRDEIGQRIVALGASKERPVTCPFLDRDSGACPVYPFRPVACRTYGFYVQRDKGLHCARIEAQVEHGELADVIWGNHLAVEDDLAHLGEVRSLADWFSAVSPIGDEDAEAPTPERHPRK